jgi:hypothetical protein
MKKKDLNTPKKKSLYTTKHLTMLITSAGTSRASKVDFPVQKSTGANTTATSSTAEGGKESLPLALYLEKDSRLEFEPRNQTTRPRWIYFQEEEPLIHGKGNPFLPPHLLSLEWI